MESTITLRAPQHRMFNKILSALTFLKNRIFSPQKKPRYFFYREEAREYFLERAERRLKAPYGAPFR